MPLPVDVVEVAVGPLVVTVATPVAATVLPVAPPVPSFVASTVQAAGTIA